MTLRQSIREAALLSAAIFCVFLTSLFAGGPHTLRWDNFEVLVPLIKWTHEMWLNGTFPLFTFNEHMGEPLLANGQAGVFYFPYTIALAITQMAGWDALGFATLTLWLHAWLGALGWFALMRAVRVAPITAGVVALGIAGGGLYQVNTTIWIDMVAAFTWFGWTALAIHLYARRRIETCAKFLLAFSVAVMGWCGHPQMTVYYGVAVILFTGAYVVAFRIDWRRIAGMASLGAAGALMAAPTVLPILGQLRISQRAAAFPREIFFERSTNWSYLIGLLNPVTAVTAEFLDRVNTGLLLYQGSWVVLGVLAGLVRLRKGPKTDVGRLFAVLAFTGGTLFWLAMGGWAGLYGLTHGLPVWSSFRWPFKIYYLALPCVAAAAGCGLQTLTVAPRAYRNGCAALVTAASLIGFVLAPGPSDPVSVLALVSALAVPGGWLISSPVFRRAFVGVAAFVNVASVVALTQSIKMNEYEEAYGSVGARDLGVEDVSRVLALSVRPNRPGTPFKMQEYANLQSAMMNDYESATGCVTALAPAWRMVWLPANVFGVPYPPLVDPLLGTYLADTYNVGYFVVDRADAKLRQTIAAQPHLRLHRELPATVVYRNTRVLPQAYWAAVVKPLVVGSIPGDFAPPHEARAAFIADLVGPVGYTRPARDPAFVKADRRVDVTLNNAEPGFLVLSYTWYPAWRATIDGRAADIHRVNGIVMGVEVPAGAKTLRLEFTYEDARTSALGFGLGALVLMGTVFAGLDRRGRRRADWPNVDGPGKLQDDEPNKTN